MQCPSCYTDNDPASEFCVRCNMALRADSAGPYGAPAAGAGRAHQPGSRPYGTVWMWSLPLVVAVITVTVAVTVAVSDGPTQPPAARPTERIVVPDPPTAANPTGARTVDPARRAAAQAAAVDRVLSASAASRRKLVAAIQQVSGCDNLARAMQRMQEVGYERQQQLAEVADLDLSALRDGERLRQLLSDALTYSLEADRGYVRWAQAAAIGTCPNSGAEHRADGDRASHLAGQSKIAFLSVWNPIAARYGLPTRTRAEI